MKIIRELYAGALLATVPATAQVPNALLHSIPAPPGAQPGALHGTSVAMDGIYTVVGAPSHSASGPTPCVKVYDSTSGALLFVLRNPAGGNHGFGHAVGISGSRVAVGAYANDTGAENAGSVFVFDLISQTPTEPVATLTNPDPNPNDNFGWSVAISGTRVAAGAYSDDAEREDTGSVHVFDLASATPAVPVAALSDPGPARPWHSYFGWSVGISGTRVAVGALFDGRGAVHAGGAYVFDIASTTPTLLLTRLKNPSPEVSDGFGASVAISGDRVVVGVPAKDGLPDNNGGADRAGMACIYDIGSITPAEPVLTLHNPQAQDYEMFGTSVAISGARVAVGVPGDDVGYSETERAYVYDLAGAMPTVPLATLHNPAQGLDDFFGTSVAVSGTRMVVGAPEDDAGAMNTGSAYIYDTASAKPAVPLVTLHNFSPEANDNFGCSVALAGTLMVVGSYYSDAGGSGSGSAYVYNPDGDTPTVPIVNLQKPRPAAGDFFGAAVAISSTRVAVGIPGDDTGATDAGSVCVYNLANAAPAVPLITLHNPSPDFGDNFGSAVAIFGTRVVVGAYLDDTRAENAGSAYVFDLASATPAVPVVTLTNPGAGSSEFFGSSVAISGSLVAAGAPYAGGVGGAYIFDLNSGTPAVPVYALNNPESNSNDVFGSSVAISGTRLLVGAPYDAAGAIEAGSVYVYDLSSDTPAVPLARLNKPMPADFDNFGRSLAISGTRAVIGSPYDDTGGTATEGTAYYFELSGAAPAVPVATLRRPGQPANDHFGNSVAIDGTAIVIGSPKSASPRVDQSFAYVFGPNSRDMDNDGLLDSWEMTHFGTTSGHGPDDDADLDGSNELLELAFGTDPLVPGTSAAPAFVQEGTYLTITITKRPGVLYTVQSADDLTDASFSAATTSVLLDDATILKVRDNVLTGAVAKRFLRVKVTAAP